jgi:hypothetical protein
MSLLTILRQCLARALDIKKRIDHACHRASLTRNGAAASSVAVFGKGKEENCCVHRQEQPGRSSSELDSIRGSYQNTESNVGSSGGPVKE